MTVPPTQCSIKVEISSPYRGGTKVWSNRYFFNRTSIPDLTHFNTLSDALVAQAKTIINASSTIIGTVGYQGGTDVPAFTKSYSQVGDITAGNPTPPLEACALIRWTTDQRTTKNHPIYLFKYVHGIQTDGTTAGDKLRGAIASNAATYGAALVTGLSDGTNTYKLAGPRGAVALAATVDQWLSHHDFPR